MRGSQHPAVFPQLHEGGMMVRYIYLVMHGEVEGVRDGKRVPDPPLTKVGREEVEAMKPGLATDPPVVVVGTGRRHIQTASLLFPDVPRHFSVFAGTQELYYTEGGKDVVLLADGQTVTREQYTGIDWLYYEILAMIGRLPHHAVICTEPQLVATIGYQQAQLGSIVGLEVDEKSRIKAVNWHQK